MTRDEMLTAFRRLSSAEGSESALNDLLRQLETALPRAEVNDLIYQSKIRRTPEQKLQEALRREGEPMIALPAPKAR